MAHPIERKIAEREAQIADVAQQITALEMRKATLCAEVAAYKDTLQYLPPSPGRGRSRQAANGREPGSGRGISEQWANLLATASMYGTEEFGIDEIVRAGELDGHEMKRASVRTQAANMVTRGVLERVSPGTFRITESGMKEIGSSNPKENGEASASPDTERDANPVQTPNPATPGA